MSAQTKNTLLIILILIGASVWYYFKGSNTTSIVIGEDGVTLSGPESEASFVPFDEVQGLEYLDAVPELGEKISGQESRSAVCGVYKNQQWGEYKVYLDAKVGSCILIRCDSGVILFSFESDATTKEFCRSFTEYLDEHSGQQ